MELGIAAEYYGGTDAAVLWEVSGGWWIWDDKAGGHVFVPLAAWKNAYREDEMLEPA